MTYMCLPISLSYLLLDSRSARKAQSFGLAQEKEHTAVAKRKQISVQVSQLLLL